MRPAERGAVTVEAAIALAALTLVLLAALGSLSAVGAAVRCQDAARELARLTARGDDRAHQAAAAVAPAGATLEVSTVGDEIRAQVTAAPIGVLPVRISGSALAIREPGALDAGISGPGALDPDAPNRGTAEPDVAEPGAAESSVAEPGALDPGAPNPGASVPDGAEPGAVDLGAPDPGAPDPDPLDPDALDPGTPDPSARDLGAFDSAGLR
ncbi:TadE family type IV pilus minor pilin [Pseudonocardia oroxyli]|uniref:TadE-like protein n=1 Tax=Pseudonocardia oroxyli TaxID=366584 RepID=A0A1G7UPY8_PSEOR|nr:TadE family type IV pilus minor pilin [Pseudonocardia oroxyli]SDG49632.1 hypothetical protein SAMN05216377_112117 [Pseudonocardia oroxyli]